MSHIGNYKSNWTDSQSRKELMFKLGECWNLYIGTNPANQDDIDDFRKGIHDLQRLVACNELEAKEPKFFGKD